MLGRQPLDILEDQRILLIYIGCFALHPAGKTEPLDDLKCELSTPEARTVSGARAEAMAADPRLVGHAEGQADPV